MEPYDATKVREVISELAEDPSLYDTLVALDEQPANPTDIAERVKVSRTTSHEWIDTLLDRGWARRRDDGQYELTAGGRLVLQECNCCFETINRETLASLSRSEYAVHSLRALDSGPLLPAGTESDEGSPSRSTATRIRTLFEKQEWVVRKDGEYAPMSAGERARDAYVDLSEMIALVEDTQPFLEIFRPNILPSRSVLKTSSLINVDANRKLMGEPLTEFTESITPDLNQFRGIVPVVNPAYIQEFRPLLESDVQIEIVADRTVLENARLEYKDVLVESLVASNLDMYMTLDDVSTGVAVFDDERAQVGVYDENYLHHASLDGTDNQFVDWATDLYESYRSDAWHIPNLASLEPALNRVADTISEQQASSDAGS